MLPMLCDSCRFGWVFVSSNWSTVVQLCLVSSNLLDWLSAFGQSGHRTYLWSWLKTKGHIRGTTLKMEHMSSGKKKNCKTPLVGDWNKKIITIHGKFIWKILKHAGKTGWHLARAVSVKPNAHTCGSTQSKSLKQCLVTFSDTPFDADPQRPTVSHRFCHHPNDHCRRMTSPPLLSWPSAPAHRRRACRPSPCLTLASSNGGMVQ